MSNDITSQLQADIKILTGSFNNMFNEALDLENLYFKGSVSADLSGSAGGDAVTSSTQLTKDQIVTILTLCENVRKFFDNVAVATADYQTTCQDVSYGVATATFFNNTVEQFGVRGVQFAKDCISQFNRGRDIENDYNSSEISAMIGSLSTYTQIYGSSMSKDQLTSAVTLTQDWDNFMNNVAPGTADRKVTLGKWSAL